MNPINTTPESKPEPTDDTTPNEPTWPTPQSVEAEVEPATNSQSSSDPLGTTINASPVSGTAPASTDSNTLDAEPSTPVVPVPSAAAAPAATTAAPVTGLGMATRSKKPLILGLVIGGVVLLLGGTAAAYQFWYQSPDKVVTDSIVKALTAKTLTYTGTLDTTGEAAKLKVELDGAANETAAFRTHAKATITMGAVNVILDADAQHGENGDLFFKLKNAKDLKSTYVQLIGGDSTPELDDLVAKIDNKWIRVSAKDLNMDDETVKQQECFDAVVDKISTDREMRDEVTSLYEKQRFITIKQSLGEKDGNLGYKLDLDRTKAKEFAIGAKKTKLYSELQKCDKDFKIDENEVTKEGDDDIALDVEIWANKWSHELAQVKMSGQAKDGSSKGSFVFNPVFNKPVTITAPTDAMPISELQASVESVVMSAMMGSTEMTETTEMTTLEQELMTQDIDQ